MKRYCIIIMLATLFCGCVDLRNKRSGNEENDSTSPLHLLKPEYNLHYGELCADTVKNIVERIFGYIERSTPAKIVDGEGKELNPGNTLPDDAMLNQGTFRLTSYEWGVTYMALLETSRLMNESRYKDYVSENIGFLSKVAPLFEELKARTGKDDGQMRQVISPASLDDAGAMAGAFMLASLSDSTLRLDTLIERYYNIVETVPPRLPDGTFSRNRPHHRAVWLDDMFMALPAMAVRGTYAGNPGLYDDAVASAEGFFKRMWMPDKRLFRHGYIEGLDQQPEMAWGRANGWALLTMTRLLDFLPDNHNGRSGIMEMYKKHIRGLADCQDKDGFLHQLLDRNDSYQETSATAIFTYCLAHGINNGWIDAETYGPVAQLAWEAVASRITPEGEVEGVCVGTGMGFDPSYYYYRPVSSKAAHGYGPVIWAGAEMYSLLSSSSPKVNDSAIHYYKTDPEATTPIFSLDENGHAMEIKH